MKPLDEALWDAYAEGRKDEAEDWNAARMLAETAVDVYEDGKLPHDDRSYVGGTFASVMDELRTALKKGTP